MDCCRLLFFSIVFLLAGCSKNDIDLKQFENKQADFIYSSAKSYMDSKKYKEAVQIFEELEKQYPYSKHIPLSQIYMADSYYNMKKYEEAATTYEIFIKTHATHKMIPYALFMLGKLSYDQILIVERDQDEAAQSLEYFETLVQQFPNSEYVKSANNFIKLTRQHLAGRELYVAKYYQSKKNYAAAICRLNTVIDNYEDTNLMPEALHRLIECYTAMGFVDEARKVFAVLDKDYKTTSWYEHSKKLLPGTIVKWR
ncbi:MAG: outer membrane protein assembly factor BamD [Holosporales bacterium]|jgi:outer membrane protein assembly factor BamD|nr:outer membrane protein assembly factor BamD [Holosporales bacterium]